MMSENELKEGKYIILSSELKITNLEKCNIGIYENKRCSNVWFIACSTCVNIMMVLPIMLM